MKMSKGDWIAAAIIILAVGWLADCYGQVYEYDPANEYNLQLTWDRPAETDIEFYVVKYRLAEQADFMERWFSIAQVQQGDSADWSIVDSFPIVAAEGDTNRYEFKLYAVDYAGNVGLDSDSAYLSLYMPDVTPPAKIMGLLLKLVVVPKTN